MCHYRRVVLSHIQINSRRFVLICTKSLVVAVFLFLSEGPLFYIYTLLSCFWDTIALRLVSRVYQSTAAGEAATGAAGVDRAAGTAGNEGMNCLSIVSGTGQILVAFAFGLRGFGSDVDAALR